MTFQLHQTPQTALEDNEMKRIAGVPIDRPYKLPSTLAEKQIDLGTAVEQAQMKKERQRLCLIWKNVATVFSTVFWPRNAIGVESSGVEEGENLNFCVLRSL